MTTSNNTQSAQPVYLIATYKRIFGDTEHRFLKPVALMDGNKVDGMNALDQHMHEQFTYFEGVSYEDREVLMDDKKPLQAFWISESEVLCFESSVEIPEEDYNILAKYLTPFVNKVVI